MTGAVVAIGALVLAAVVAAGIAAAGHMRTDTLTGNTALRAGIALAAGAVAAQLLAYLWGGYTAGRMARGAGARNGVLVAVLAVVLGGLGVLVATSLDIATRMQIPFSTFRLGLTHARLVQIATVTGLASLAAMLAGGALGGALGARWHLKLERRAATPDVTAPRTATRDATDRRTVDLRDPTVEGPVKDAAAADARR